MQRPGTEIFNNDDIDFMTSEQDHSDALGTGTGTGTGAGMKQEDRAAFEFLYAKCIESRNFEIEQLVARNNFFMVFQGVLFAGLAQASGSAPPVVLFAVCLVGTVASLFQAAMASGAKFWQDRWQDKLEAIENGLLVQLGSLQTMGVRSMPPVALFTDKPDLPAASNTNAQGTLASLPRPTVRRFSVSRIPIYVGRVFAIIWLILLGCTVSGPFGRLVPDFIVGFPK